MANEFESGGPRENSAAIAGAKKKPIRPLGDRVLVKQEGASMVSPGGLHLPGADKVKPSQGVVIAVGPGRIDFGKLVPIEVKVGDVVAYTQFCGADITVDGEDLLIIRESDIIAVVG